MEQTPDGSIPPAAVHDGSRRALAVRTGQIVAGLLLVMSGLVLAMAGLFRAGPETPIGLIQSLAGLACVLVGGGFLAMTALPWRHWMERWRQDDNGPAAP